MPRRVPTRKEPKERRSKIFRLRKFIFGILVLIIALAGIYFLPPVHERLAWRLAALQADIAYSLNPPEEAVFFPEEQPEVSHQAESLQLTAAPTEVERQPAPTNVPLSTASPMPMPTALPAQVKLEGVAHQYQKWNNCGPATLSMALSYWGWEGNQQDTAAYLKPNPGDVNVMPFEMTGYVEDETDMLAIRRVGGDLALIKSMVANGYAVIVEKGTDYKDGWVGHYVLVTGYDDGREMFITQDSLAGVDFEVAYEEILSNWRVFNYTFIIVYPSESEAEVMTLLGPWVDEAWAAGHALNLASQQIESEVGRALYFAWFNKGSSHVLRGEYAAAASAYDVAFDLYSRLPVDERPWRMMWYQTGPYEAYYQAGRYNDVINLANTTLWAAARSVMEESYYWRGMAKEALGDLDGALSDYRKSVDMNPNFGLGIEALERLEQGN